MDNKTQSLKNNVKGKDKNFITKLEYTETFVVSETKKFQRILFFTNLIALQDENGKLRRTRHGDHYKVEIKNGEITFNKPLKFVETK